MEGAEENNFESYIDAAFNGEMILDAVKKLPTDNSKLGYSLTMNRILKWVAAKYPDLIVNANSLKWKSLTAEQRDLVINTVKSAKDGDLRLIKDVVLGHSHVGNSSTTRSGIERCHCTAFLGHLVADPALTTLLSKLLNNLEDHQIPGVLTNGFKNYKAELLQSIITTANIQKATYINPFKVQYPSLSFFDPTKGSIDPDKFQSFYTTAKNKVDYLRDRLDRSGRNESGDIEDSTALQFTKGLDGTKPPDLELFYLYLCWKDVDLRFTSNQLPDDIGLAAGYDEAQYFSHPSPSRSSSVDASLPIILDDDTPANDTPKPTTSKKTIPIKTGRGARKKKFEAGEALEVFSSACEKLIGDQGNEAIQAATLEEKKANAELLRKRAKIEEDNHKLNKLKAAYESNALTDEQKAEIQNKIFAIAMDL